MADLPDPLDCLATFPVKLCQACAGAGFHEDAGTARYHHECFACGGTGVLSLAPTNQNQEAPRGQT